MGELIFLTLLTAAGLWVGVCNSRTRDQRKRIINKIYACPEWAELDKMLDRVSYDRHLLALIVGRDPRKLYHPKIVGLIDQT